MKAKYYLIERNVTDEFENSWLSSIEQKHGHRPIIYQKIAASPEVSTHYCSANKMAELVLGRYVIVNWDMFPESLEEDLNSGWGDPTTLVGFSDFWSDVTDEDTSEIKGSLLGDFDIDNHEGFESLRDAMAQWGA